MKTSELTGAALDWAVAKCEGMHVWRARGGWFVFDSDAFSEYRNDYNDDKLQAFRPSINWSQGGPIIERERMAIRFVPECYWHFTTPTDTWTANYEGVGEWIGPTPLIAAMRCFVASKLGEEVDLPGELE